MFRCAPSVSRLLLLLFSSCSITALAVHVLLPVHADPCSSVDDPGAVRHRPPAVEASTLLSGRACRPETRPDALAGSCINLLPNLGNFRTSRGGGATGWAGRARPAFFGAAVYLMLLRLRGSSGRPGAPSSNRKGAAVGGDSPPSLRRRPGSHGFSTALTCLLPGPGHGCRGPDRKRKARRLHPPRFLYLPVREAPQRWMGGFGFERDPGPDVLYLWVDPVTTGTTTSRTATPTWSGILRPGESHRARSALPRSLPRRSAHHDGPRARQSGGWR